MGTFIELLRNDPDTSTDSVEPVEPGEPGDGDLVRYCFRYRGQCAMGIVWRDGYHDKYSEYVLLSVWVDAQGVEHRASWVICGSWEIGDLFSVSNRLEDGLQSKILHGLRLNEEGVNALIMFVSSVQSPMCGLRFETEREHFCVLDEQPHPCYERVPMPKDSIYALLELIQANPIFGEDESLSSALMRCNSKQFPWVERKHQWRHIQRSPLNDALVGWLSTLSAIGTLVRASDNAPPTWSPFKRPHARGSSGEPAPSLRPFSAPR